MIMVQWSCDVPQEKVEGFLRFAKERLKPFFESRGCRRYELFTPMDSPKRYFSYQETPDTNRYTEQMVFDDVDDWDSFFESAEEDPEAREILASYEREFNVTSCAFMILNEEI